MNVVYIYTLGNTNQKLIKTKCKQVLRSSKHIKISILQLHHLSRYC